MGCKGKCYLAKQLKAQDQQEKQSPNSKREKFEIQPFFLPATISLSNFPNLIVVEYKTSIDRIPATFPRTIFHPPSV